ncbi:MAG: phosphate/phosphite/phosphonate ABC transporter substrate-binding protein [Myxococcaceae bacterium]
MPMPVIAPPPPRQTFRFALPPSLGADAAKERAARLERHLGITLGRHAEVVVAASYEGLAKDLLGGKLDAAWAPPFVCARIEAMGVRVLVRGVRRGASQYRAALVARADAKVTLDKLAGLTAVWTDRDSVGGYLLAVAFLRAKGLDPSKVFFAQQFAGSYRAALDTLLAGKADLSSVFAPPQSPGAPDNSGLEQLAPERKGELEVVAFTETSPNDGVAVSMSASPVLVTALEKTLLTLHQSEEGVALLSGTFSAERFEPAPRMGYRALYRVALASL